jgi:hypothetical protein
MKPEDLNTVVTYAALAPSVLNTQPWTFSAENDLVEVRADRRRALAVLDPQGRELTVSCGAAIEFARLAVRGLGWECAVEPLPLVDDPDLLARLSIGAMRPATPQERELVEAIPRRYTDRGAYDPTPIAPALIAELVRGVSGRGAWVRVLDHAGDRTAVIRALSHAEAAESADPAYRAELHRWMRTGGAPDGIPLGTDGSAEPDSVNDVPTRDFTGANEHPRPGGDGPPPDVERDLLVMIGTSGDDPISWINAGRALGWLLLRLTAAGLSSQPLGQALDIEAYRQRLATEIGLIGHVQFLLRIGVGHGHPTTGRRLAATTPA